MNLLKFACWEQFGGGPDAGLLKGMAPMRRGHKSLVDEALAAEEARAESMN